MPEEVNTTAVPQEAAAENQAAAEAAEETGRKETIYEKIGDFVKAKTSKRIGKTGGREIFDLVVAEVFAAAATEGTFRFNGGFGSLHVRQYQPGSRRLPSGQMTTFGDREKMRYEQGVVVTALIGNKGNLEEALKVRGTRGKESAEKEAVKETEKKAAKVAKADKKADKKAATTPAAVPAGEGGGEEIDLS